MKRTFNEYDGRNIIIVDHMCGSWFSRPFDLFNASWSSAYLVHMRSIFLWIGIQTTQSKMAYNTRYNVEVAIERNKLCAMLLQNKFKSILSLWTKDGKQEERHRKKNKDKDEEWDVRNVQVRFGQMDMKNNEKHQAWNCIVREGREINLSLFKTQLYGKLYSCHNIVLCIWNDVFRFVRPQLFLFLVFFVKRRQSVSAH